VCCCHFKAIKGRFWSESVWKQCFLALLALPFSSTDALEWVLCENCKRRMLCLSLYRDIMFNDFCTNGDSTVKASIVRCRAPRQRARALFMVYFARCIWCCISVLNCHCLHSCAWAKLWARDSVVFRLYFTHLLLLCLSSPVTHFSESVLLNWPFLKSPWNQNWSFFFYF